MSASSEFLCTSKKMVRDVAEPFDSEVLQLAKSNTIIKERDCFINFSQFSNTVCHLKTKFYKKLYTDINNLRMYGESEERICGIKGFGTTTTLIYIMLECFSKNDFGLHYFDLKRIAVHDKDLQKFKQYAKNIKKNHCVILDHVTLCNINLLHMIKDIIKYMDVRVIQVETGFTARAQSSVLACKQGQLDKEDFILLWTECLKNIENPQEGVIEKLVARGEETFSYFSKSFMITPSLLHFVWRSMYIHNCSLFDTCFRYKKHLENSILDFLVIKDENKHFVKFLLHTRVILHFLPKDGAFVLTCDQFEKLKVAINIFDVERRTFTQNDRLTDSNVNEMGLNIGDEYMIIRHLVPAVADYWKEQLPCIWENLVNLVDFKQLLSIMFQHGAPRKEIEKLIVKIQERNAMVILPFHAAHTFYSPSNSECRLPISENTAFVNMRKVQFLSVDHEALAPIHTECTEFTGYEKIVAKCVMWIKNRKSTDSFVLHPDIPNILGIDYFVYCFDEKLQSSDGCSVVKQQKREATLYLVQVTTGQSYSGETVGKAFNVVKKVFSDFDNLVIHVVIVIARKSEDSYSLTKCHFENVTVINLASPENLTSISKLDDSFLLHNLLIKLAS